MFFLVCYVQNTTFAKFNNNFDGDLMLNNSFSIEHKVLLLELLWPVTCLKIKLQITSENPVTLQP